MKKSVISGIMEMFGNQVYVWSAKLIAMCTIIAYVSHGNELNFTESIQADSLAGGCPLQLLLCNAKEHCCAQPGVLLHSANRGEGS